MISELSAKYQMDTARGGVVVSMTTIWVRSPDRAYYRCKNLALIIKDCIYVPFRETPSLCHPRQSCILSFRLIYYNFNKRLGTCVVF